MRTLAATWRDGTGAARGRTGAAAAAYILALPLVGDDAEGVLTVAWVAFIVALGLYAWRQPVWREGFGRRYYAFIAVYVALFTVVVVAGALWFEGKWGWYAPGALVAAAPAFVTAWREART